MQINSAIYSEFTEFFASAIEDSKDKIGLYNQLVGGSSRRVTNDGIMGLMQIIIVVLRELGWFAFVALSAFVALGLLGFFGGMGTLIAVNPVMAAVVATIGGGGVYLIWRNREVLERLKEVGDRYKVEFSAAVALYPDGDIQRKRTIDELHARCIKSICVDVYQIANDDNAL